MEYSCTALGDYATTIYSGVSARKVHVSHVILTPDDDSLGRYGHLLSLKLPATVQKVDTALCKKLGGILFERFINPTLTPSNQEEGDMVYTQMGTCVEWKNPVCFSKAGDSKLDFSMTK